MTSAAKTRPRWFWPRARTIALKILEIAEEHGIPVIEDKALVRSMYDGVEVDRIIPNEFFRAVAEIIYFLHTAGRPVA